MKNLLAGIAFFCCVYTSSAQSDTTKQPLKVVVADTTKTENGETITYNLVEIESVFPGGLSAWKNFLSRNLKYPKQAIDQRIEGTVVLKFVVCQDGTVCDIKAISGPEILRETAINAMKKTPNWVPAYQKGQVVRSYKKQPIVFRLGRSSTERKPAFGMRQKTRNPWD